MAPVAPTTEWHRPNALLRVRTFAYLVLLDIVCIAVSFVFGATLRGTLSSAINWGVMLAVAVPLYVVVALNGGAYSPAVLFDRFKAVARALRCFLVALAILVLVAFYLKTTQEFSRVTIAVGSINAIALLAICRYLFVRYLPAIVGGDPYAVALIWETGQPVPAEHFSIVIAADSLIDPDNSHDPLMYERLARALTGVYNVVVSCAPQRRLAWTNALKGANIQGEILLPELDMLAPMGTNSHGSMTSVVIAHGPLNLVDRAIKRGFDVAVSLGALTILSPVFLAIAVAVRIDSAGPIFFRQKRLGRANHVFEVLKFRSMRVDHSDTAGDRSTARDDDRITRIGRLIRQTSLDELPQLLNVLRGEMSIVGPRPHALGSRAADKLFWEVDGRYWHRHAAKPGLTGLAQVRGFRGATIEEVDLLNRLQADLEYLDTWSIWRDLKIIAQTFKVMIHRNAF